MNIKVQPISGMTVKMTELDVSMSFDAITQIEHNIRSIYIISRRDDKVGDDNKSSQYQI